MAKLLAICGGGRSQDVLLLLPRRIVMKTMITALAVTAILSTSVVAQTARNRNKEVRVQQNTLLSRNAVSRNPVAQIKSHCRFEHGETDPDPRVRLELARDCRWYEDDTSD
jgi:hypothetical protein